MTLFPGSRDDEYTFSRTGRKYLHADPSSNIARPAHEGGVPDFARAALGGLTSVIQDHTRE